MVAHHRIEEVEEEDHVPTIECKITTIVPQHPVAITTMDIHHPGLRMVDPTILVMVQMVVVVNHEEWMIQDHQPDA